MPPYFIQHLSTVFQQFLCDVPYAGNSGVFQQILSEFLKKFPRSFSRSFFGNLYRSFAGNLYRSFYVIPLKKYTGIASGVTTEIPQELPLLIWPENPPDMSPASELLNKSSGNSPAFPSENTWWVCLGIYSSGFLGTPSPSSTHVLQQYMLLFVWLNSDI